MVGTAPAVAKLPGMNFAIYIHAGDVPSLQTGEDFFVPATNELQRYLDE